MTNCYLEYTNGYKKLKSGIKKEEEYSVYNEKIPESLKVRFICENNKSLLSDEFINQLNRIQNIFKNKNKKELLNLIFV